MGVNGNGGYGIGLHQGVTADEYHADCLGTPVPTLSASIANILAEQSALHAWWAHPRLGVGSSTSTDATDRGAILHRLLLGKGEDFVQVDAKDWRTDKAKEAREAIRADGKIPVLAANLAEYERTAAAVRLRLADCGIAFRGQSEVTGLWQSDGVLSRCRFDHHLAEEFTIIDLKSTTNAAPDAVQRSMVSFGSDVQRAAYVEAHEALIPASVGRVRMLYVYFEVEPPHAVLVTEMAGTMRELGERKWKRARALWKRCLADGVGEEHWPAYGTGVMRIEAPAWAVAKDVELEMQRMEVSNGSEPF